MKCLFEDESFSFETMRTTGFAAYGGADIGEVLSAARHIEDGNEAGWHHQTMFDWLDAILASSSGPWEVAVARRR